MRVHTLQSTRPDTYALLDVPCEHTSRQYQRNTQDEFVPKRRGTELLSIIANSGWVYLDGRERGSFDCIESTKEMRYKHYRGDEDGSRKQDYIQETKRKVWRGTL